MDRTGVPETTMYIHCDAWTEENQVHPSAQVRLRAALETVTHAQACQFAAQRHLGSRVLLTLTLHPRA